LEPSEPGFLNHYVVVLVANHKHVRVADPSLGLCYDLSFDAFSRLSSGYYLADVGSENRSWVQASVWAALLAASFFGLAACVRRRSQRSMGRGTLQAGLSCVLLLVGCNAPGPSSASVDASKKKLAVSQLSNNLGLVSPGSVAEARFEITNISDAPVVVRLGEPSCGCASATIETTNRLGPDDGCTLVLKLMTDPRSVSGRVGANVKLSCGDDEVYTFDASAVIEGPVLSAYRILGAPVSRGPIAPLKFSFLTRPDGPPWKIERITVYRQSASMAADNPPNAVGPKPGPRPKSNSAPKAAHGEVVDGFLARLDLLTVSKGLAGVGEGYAAFNVVAPMEVACESLDSLAGFLEVEYTIGERGFLSRTPFYCVPGY
jgi:hypothetical protein